MLAAVAVAALLALTLLSLGNADPSPTPSPRAAPTATAAAVVTPSPAPSATALPVLTPGPQPGATASPSATPPSPYAPLDGMPAEPELAHRLPLAVMIDNNRRARPQAGFNRASIVFQAPNDGGTDRYMFIFQEQDAELIGPVRSTRPFFVAWVSEYQPALAHYGGDWKAIRRVTELDGELLFDIDALAGSERAYWRDKTRRAPFNAYTSSERLWAEAERKGAPTLMVDGVAQRTFDDDRAADSRPVNGSITIPYRHGDTSYEYDHERNHYRRSVAGERQRDAMDGSRVTARNVIVQFVDVFYDPTQRYNRAVMQYLGAGRSIVFRDGLAIEGTWRKDSETDLTRFLDESGNEISLVRGAIYIQVVPERANVAFKVGPLP
jgi:hypothetical protein